MLVAIEADRPSNENSLETAIDENVDENDDDEEKCFDREICERSDRKVHYHYLGKKSVGYLPLLCPFSF